MKERIATYMFQRYRRTRKIRTEQYLVGTFALVILVGTLLLMLPFSSRSGESCGFLTALFTATSSTCVTGLVLADRW